MYLAGQSVYYGREGDRSVKRRIGIFSIDIKLVHTDPEMVQKVMSKVIVTRCEMIFHKDVFEYVALSPHFDELSEGESPPTYQVVLGDDVWFMRVRDFTLRM